MADFDPDAFPVLCEKCLGPNPYLRMTMIPLGASCRISNAPFTVHKWKAPGIARQRETIISRDVAVTKNVCQCCLLDLEYGLPSHVVDSLVAAVSGPSGLPSSEANREFFWDEKRRAVADGREDGGESYGKLRAHMGKIERIAAMAPYVNPYHGTGPGQVPAPREPQPERKDGDRRDRPPRDQSVTTLYLTGITPSMDERQLTPYFAPYGAIALININIDRYCAHIKFHDRASAFHCVEGLRDKLTVQGTRLRVMWARGGDRTHGPGASGSARPPPGVRPTPPPAGGPPGIRAADAGELTTYPSSSVVALDATGARPDV
ncbi:hypothetical protein T492DRAFT_1068937 [Pavlovales sp. CCMP2436]|nr:hypothetical protein T492DRAFT_1068937 [Pavlovales sp. CCMP2436]